MSSDRMTELTGGRRGRNTNADEVTVHIDEEEEAPRKPKKKKKKPVDEDQEEGKTAGGDGESKDVKVSVADEDKAFEPIRTNIDTIKQQTAALNKLNLNATDEKVCIIYCHCHTSLVCIILLILTRVHVSNNRVVNN
jgi:hypothetical protein